MKNSAAKIAAALAITAIALPMIASSVQAATNETTSPTTTFLVTQSNAEFARTNHSTELTNAKLSTTATAWDTISGDAQFSKFAALVKAVGLEGEFNKSSSKSTFLVPTNDAFAVLDEAQVAKLSAANFKTQATTIVKEMIATDAVSFADMVRELPTGLAPVVTPPIETCATIESVVIVEVYYAGSISCSYVAALVAVVPDAISTLTTANGTALQIEASIVPGDTEVNHFLVTLEGGAVVNTADYHVTNGIIHTVDSLIIPAELGQNLTDIVGR
jgi:uncharacterized surface protein with fasciclin (FAS1) repeats